MKLRSFSMEPVVALYFSQYRQARRAADELRENGLDPLEADINPADRFLMERFVAGSALLYGEVQRHEQYLLLRDPAIKASQYLPSLKVVSFDIETAMEGIQLYSIAVHGKSAQGEERRVFMLGAGAEQAYVTTCATQEAVLEAFVDWLSEYDPDVLIGWNVVNFDARYLQRLADHLGRRCCWVAIVVRDIGATWMMKANVLPSSFQGGWYSMVLSCCARPFIASRVLPWIMFAYQLLGEGKLLHGGDRGAEITRQFREDKTSLARYNLKDCELVSEIFAVTGMLDFAVARSVMTGPQYGSDGWIGSNF